MSLRGFWVLASHRTLQLNDLGCPLCFSPALPPLQLNLSGSRHGHSSKCPCDEPSQRSAEIRWHSAAPASQDAPNNYIVCRIYARRHCSYSQQHSGVTMIQSNEDRDSVGFFGRGGEWLKASDGKNQRLQLFRVHTAYLSHSGSRWDKLAAECQNPV